MGKNTAGFIYILTNPSFPEYVKIGYADDVDRRINQLNSSEAVPFAFRKYATYAVEDRLEDIAVHRLLDIANPALRSVDSVAGKKRIREFYAMSAEDAYTILETIATLSGHIERLKAYKQTASERKDEETAREIAVTSEKKAEMFKFSLCDIKVGEFITWHIDPNMKFEVVNDKKVRYEGKDWSLTPLAKHILGTSWALAGPKYFKYKGKYLNDIRREKGKM